jgi:signal transduction histidine kinase
MDLRSMAQTKRSTAGAPATLPCNNGVREFNCMSPLAEILNQLAAGQIPREIPPDCDSREELQGLIDYLAELNRFTGAIAAGDLDATLRRGGPLAGCLKGMHANLRHLTWQTQQVADGDFDQRVDFLGEFSTAFNSMVAALAQAREDLTEKNRQLAAAIEELKTTQSQLLQQDKMAAIGQLAAGVAHEINNPIGFISSNLRTMGKYVDRFAQFISAQDEVLTDAAPSGAKTQLAECRKRLKIDYALEDVESMLAESVDGAERIRVIVENLKSFSCLDESDFQETDLNACLESTISIAFNELQKKAAIEREYGELLSISCMPRELNQVFLNLLLNAAHAIDTQGVIKVRTWHEDSVVFVAISDTGCGIPDGIKNRIFEPFFTTREVGKGTGLGLSISYDIVKKHNGNIKVDSMVNKGSTFTVSLPIVKS